MFARQNLWVRFNRKRQVRSELIAKMRMPAQKRHGSHHEGKDYYYKSVIKWQHDGRRDDIGLLSVYGWSATQETHLWALPSTIDHAAAEPHS